MYDDDRYTVYATEADAHREEGEARLQDGLVCHHGRPAGFSNYDVRWCGACEAEEYEEYQREMAGDDEPVEDAGPTLPPRVGRPSSLPMHDDIPF